MFQRLLKYKKIILAAVLPFVFWGALLTLWFYRAPQSIGSPSATISKNGAGKISISDIAQDMKAIDSDNDGLMDWEESIYGTNTGNTDSDGDGYLDGEEVLSGHNPAKKGPDDFLEKKQGALTKEQQNKKTATDAFARIAFQNFLTNPTTQNWQDLSPEELDRRLKDSFKGNPEVMDEFKAQMRDVLFEFVPVGLDEKIKISDKSLPDDDQKYMDYFIKIIKSAQEKYKDVPELSNVITAAFERADFTKIDGAIAYYNTLYEELLKITAPKPMAIPHREGLMLFYETAKILEAVKGWESDPVRGLVAIQKYQGWIDKMEKIWKSTDLEQ